jgi:tetratricopeptide (TPR) repeat protein
LARALPSRWARLAPFALVLLAVAPLLPTLRALFVYDDTTIIRDNVNLRGWGALVHLWGQPYWPSDGGVDALGLYRPLHLALLAGVWNASGGSARWFHVYALTLAALTALGVWWLLRRGAGAGAAFVAAAWFATHPLHVEAVASVANTSELIVVLCTLALVRVLSAPDDALAASRSTDWKRALLVGLLAGAALLAKESGLLAVPLAALTEWGWQLRATERASWRGWARANARAWAASLIAIVAVLLSRSVVLGTPVARASIAAQGLETLSAPERVRAMMSLWPRIAETLVWPAKLSPYYGPSVFPDRVALLAGLGLLLLTGAVIGALVLARRGERRPAVAIGWVVLTYLPASNLLTATGQILSDRTLFGATVGAAMLIAWALDRAPRIARRAAMVVLALAIVRATFASASYAVAWTNHRALWTRMIESAPNEHLGYKLLGIDARARGDTARARAMLGHAFSMAPADRQIRFEYGQLLYGTARYAEAVQMLAPLAHDADVIAERGFVALYLDAVGRAGGPAAVVREAAPLLHSESAPVAALFLGVAQEQLGNRDAADSAYAIGLRRSPRDTALAARRAALKRGAAAR